MKQGAGPSSSSLIETRGYFLALWLKRFQGDMLWLKYFVSVSSNNFPDFVYLSIRNVLQYLNTWFCVHLRLTYIASEKNNCNRKLQNLFNLYYICVNINRQMKKSPPQWRLELPLFHDIFWFETEVRTFLINLDFSYNYFAAISHKRTLHLILCLSPKTHNGEKYFLT